MAAVVMDQEEFQRKSCIAISGDDKCNFNFDYVPGTQGLFSQLQNELKKQLYIQLEFDVSTSSGDEMLTIGNDNQLLEVLENTSKDEDPLLLIVNERGERAHSNERTFTFVINCDEEEHRTVITYQINDIAGLYNYCLEEIKKTLFFDESTQITIAQIGKKLVIEGEKRSDMGNQEIIPLMTDEEIAALPAFAVVPLKVEIKGDLVPVLDRQQEIELLYYGWCDILDGQFDAEDLRHIFGMVKDDDGQLLPPDDKVMVKLSEFAAQDHPQSIENLLPVLLLFTDHMNASECAAFCHRCRDIIDFDINVSVDFRLRRAVSSSYCLLAVNGKVNTQELAKVLSDTQNFDPAIIEQILEGAPEELDSMQYKDVMISLLASRPKDVIDILAVTSDITEHPISLLEKEIGVWRRKRLRSDIRHTMDGVSAFALTTLSESNKDTEDRIFLDLYFVIASLLNASCVKKAESSTVEHACRDYVIDSIDTEQKAKNFMERLTHFTHSRISHESLTDVCYRLLDPRMEPSALLQIQMGSWALGRWALKATLLECHNKRLPFPPIPVPGAVSPSRLRAISTKDERQEALTATGITSPARLRNIAEQAQKSGELMPISIVDMMGFYEFQYPKLDTGLFLPDEIPAESLKSLLNNANKKPSSSNQKKDKEKGKKSDNDDDDYCANEL